MKDVVPGIRRAAGNTAIGAMQLDLCGSTPNVPPQMLNDMLTWFGIDRLRNYTSRVFPDKSRFFYQKKAA